MNKRLDWKWYTCKEGAHRWKSHEWAEHSHFEEETILTCDEHEKERKVIVGFTIKPSYMGEKDRVLKTAVGDAKRETAAQEYLQAERAKEMRTSGKARRYEKDRKEYIMKAKPEWVKKGRNPKDLPHI